MKKWQLQVAKAKFSEMVREASVDGPQKITLHGEPVAVILSIAHYDKMKAHKPGFVDFMLRSPLVGLDIDFEHL